MSRPIIISKSKHSLLVLALAAILVCCIPNTTLALAPGFRKRAPQRQQQQSSSSSTSLPQYQRPPQSLVRTAADQKWQEMHGNYVLRPPTHIAQPPRAILHFIGGAFFGAAPHVSYRYLLERLAAAGYLIVATPYHMSFNHLEMCATVTQRFEALWPSLQAELLDNDNNLPPIVGVGHSCGSLLHLLMSSQAPTLASASDATTAAITTSTTTSTPLPQKQANVFISFNNHPATESIPYLDEIVAPLAQKYANYYANNPNQLNFVRLLHEARAASDVGMLLQLTERAETRAEQDLDFLWHEMQRAATLFGGRGNNKPPPFFVPQPPQPPPVHRVAKQGLRTLLRPAKRTLQAMTLLNQVVDAMDQIPALLQEMSTTGRTEFHPAPSRIRDMVSRSYAAPRTLMVQYTDDDIDQSEEMEQLLLGSRGPGVVVSRRVLSGGHMAPLVAPPLHIVTRAEARLGKDAAQERLLYKAADATVAELTAWLEEETTTSSSLPQQRQSSTPAQVAAARAQ